jgi:hypothetical protein
MITPEPPTAQQLLVFAHDTALNPLGTFVALETCIVQLAPPLDVEMIQPLFEQRPLLMTKHPLLPTTEQ